MSSTIISAITKANSRKSLFHFTRTTNLPAIAYLDKLLSSYALYPEFAGERRTTAKQVRYQNYQVTINAHLRISEEMIDPASTLEQFRACLDQHVFFWPTAKDCRKMVETYAGREPEQGFAVLEFDAISLLTAYFGRVKLSKYDSGSSPRFPKSCTYRKSPAMFLPLGQFQTINNNLVPTKPSDIKEVLIKDHVSDVSHYLRTLYMDDTRNVPPHWGAQTMPLASL
ncbi:hypothetical protein LOZ80_16810 [Paenibacillus sp. HWE-109]|uniref:DUF7002 family protein n=1 Tax=Paenibacillus sp. HWE-109 TaxID=1306526 RepID=UPI001EE0EF47|nr:hypothetical protein [Paenibacillus sp. HWE-109]UKS30509.1 hypothetical protein LOZ80_16810 [Paenibacillus sp. HWE-109]